MPNSFRLLLISRRNRHVEAEFAEAVLVTLELQILIYTINESERILNP
jgi:hypothetical protein